MQLPLIMPVAIPKSAYDYGSRSSGETHGVVLTKPHVVDLILDLAGYTVDRPLASLRLLEPSCGTGAFLLRALERLLAAAQRDGVALSALAPALVAIDIDGAHVGETRAAVRKRLLGAGAAFGDADHLARTWVREADFLLTPLPLFDVVVGNPPYVRIEQIAPVLQAEYRRRYRTIYDRADLYVAFIERGLELLQPGGVLSYVCADRWILNRYGAPLRKLITQHYGVRAYVDLHNASPFESDVIAYPSVFAIARTAQGAVRVGSMATASESECAAVSADHLQGTQHVSWRCDGWFAGDAPWVIAGGAQLAVLRDLEARLPALEDDGQTRVRIGVATGADEAYIVPADADIEADRLVPLVMRDDIDGGTVKDGRRCVLNTFGPAGKAIDLDEYPKLAAHLARFPAVRQRHVATKNPRAWFRTIDRVYPELVATPKLLIPDIAGANQVVFEAGRFHPHHNLYFITSSVWDLEVLGGLLSSRVALFFVWSYAVKMRGGYLRFQAQYLRRIRVPRPGELSESLREAIRQAYRARDFARLDALAVEAYGLVALPDFAFVDSR